MSSEFMHDRQVVAPEIKALRQLFRVTSFNDQLDALREAVSTKTEPVKSLQKKVDERGPIKVFRI